MQTIVVHKCVNEFGGGSYLSLSVEEDILAPIKQIQIYWNVFDSIHTCIVFALSFKLVVTSYCFPSLINELNKIFDICLLYISVRVVNLSLLKNYPLILS